MAAEQEERRGGRNVEDTVEQALWMSYDERKN